MKKTKTSTRTRFDFRINETRKTEGDESESFLKLVNTLADKLIPYSIGRMCYLMHDNDDCIMYVSVSNDYLEIYEDEIWKE